MNQELLFAKSLENIRALASEQGNCVSKEQVSEVFAPLGLSEEKLEMVYDYLKAHKIGIGEPVDMDEYLSDEEKNYLENYLAEIAELPRYSDGELEAFTISSMAGEADAKTKLTLANLGQVVEIAKLYAGQGVGLEDLIGEGNVALSFGMEMLGSVEHHREVPSMLARMIMNAMEELIAETADNAKTDKKIEDKVNKVASAAAELAEELGRKVTVEELSKETSLSEKSIREAMRMSGFKIEDITDEQNDV